MFLQVYIQTMMVQNSSLRGYRPSTLRLILNSSFSSSFRLYPDTIERPDDEHLKFTFNQLVEIEVDSLPSSSSSTRHATDLCTELLLQVYSDRYGDEKDFLAHACLYCKNKGLCDTEVESYTVPLLILGDEDKDGGGADSGITLATGYSIQSIGTDPTVRCIHHPKSGMIGKSSSIRGKARRNAARRRRESRNRIETRRRSEKYGDITRESIVLIHDKNKNTALDNKNSNRYDWESFVRDAPTPGIRILQSDLEMDVNMSMHNGTGHTKVVNAKAKDQNLDDSSLSSPSPFISSSLTLTTKEDIGHEDSLTSASGASGSRSRNQSMNLSIQGGVDVKDEEDYMEKYTRVKGFVFGDVNAYPYQDSDTRAIDWTDGVGDPVEGYDISTSTSTNTSAKANTSTIWFGVVGVGVGILFNRLKL